MGYIVVQKEFMKAGCNYNMKLYLFLAGCILLVLSCNRTASISSELERINDTLDRYHLAAAEAKFKNYFNHFAEDSYFLGTDASEHWNKKAFMEFSRPYFEKGHAWNFKAIERNIFLSDDQKIAWFDELLDTQMKICRGSGVLVQLNNQWMIKHYVLSMTIPNELADSVVRIKTLLENQLIQARSNKRTQ